MFKEINQLILIPRGLMVNVLDWSFEINKFKHLSPYYVHFQVNTLVNSIEFLYPPRYVLNSIIAAFLQDRYWY